MREYITKEQAMRRFKPFGREIPKDLVFEVIASLQEEIVRCKDCKHYIEWQNGAGSCQRSENSCFWFGVDFNDFCSFGERSEE